jgi:hypothetical protein
MADAARKRFRGKAVTDFETTEADWSERETVEPAGWPIRPLLLAALGLATGLAAHFLLGDEPFYNFELSALTLAELTVLTVTAGLIGFTIERRLWWAAVLFSLVCGVVAGALVWWNGPPTGWSGGDGWRMLCLFLAVAIAAPLFQAARDAETMRFPYASVHDHAWSNIVLWGACWAFVGIVFALTGLLSALFHLIRIDFLKDLLEKPWFWRALTGLAFGGALGMLREHQLVVRLLQRVVATVLAVLAPVLAVGLILFVLALPFTGLGALWDATSATTPILLACVAGSLVLANAVIGEMPEHERKFPLLKFGAMGLALVVFPLTVIAAIAIGLRIDQYGFTPERLWALTFVIIATAYALAYLVALLRGRLYWAEVVRPANLRLAFAVCGVALLLATPLVSFNAISTRDQVARLESGRISPDKFDWRALAFDFGQPGKDALKKLQASSNAAIKEEADATAKAESRWDVGHILPDDRKFSGTFDIRPEGASVPDLLRTKVLQSPGGTCTGKAVCRIYMQPDGKSAAVVSDACMLLPPEKRAEPKAKCTITAVAFVLRENEWIESSELSSPFEMVRPDKMTEDQERESLRKERAAIDAGRVEIRDVTEKQLFVGDKPIGKPFRQP